MSGGANRKKVNRAQGWEEAGAEFYQESYPSNDAELHDVLLQRDPKHLATLLPSKQNRAAATIRMRNTDTRTFRRQTSSRSRRDSMRRPSTYADVQVSMLPDLSEPISNEEATWEKIMQIKELPVPMVQKKEMKAKMQSAPNLRLQGYEQFKWKRKIIWQRYEQMFQTTLSKLEIWKKDFKRIEGNFGTGVVAYFLFIKWLIIMNILIFLFIFLFIILPTILSSDQPRQPCFSTNVSNGEYVNNSFENCVNAYFELDLNNNFIIFDIVQGTGRMERTLFFYGYYSNNILKYFIGETAFYYSLPLAYISVIAVVFLISLFAIIKAAARGFKGHLVEGEGQFYQYCNLIFGGWDFCIHNEKSGVMKSNAIFNEVKASLEAEKLEEEKKNRTKKEKTTLIIVRVFINLLVLIILLGSGAAIYFVYRFHSGINSDGTDDILSLFYEFLPSLTIVCLNIVVPFMFTFLVMFEHYSPIFIVKITLARTVFLRLASLIVLYVTLYTFISCELEEDECYSQTCSDTPCWETFVGQEIYKLTLTNFAIQIILTFVVNFPRALIDKHSNSNFAKFIGEQNFDLPKHVLDIVYMQTLCWLGSFYAPMLPALFVFIFFFMFYIKKFACLVNSKPSSVVYRASRCNSMFMTVLLISFITALIPITYSIAEVRPSKSCGPFRCVTTVWTIVGDSFLQTPQWIQDLTYFITTAFFAVPVFVLLILLLYYFTAVNSANRHMVRVLKEQLVLEGHDKQFLLERLSLFIKQQQEAQKQLRRSEMMREGDRNISSN